MNPSDRRMIVRRYTKRLKKFGRSTQTLGYQIDRQDIRFKALTDPILMFLENDSSAVLDVGCGFADLYDFLINIGWRGKYFGLDINPELLEVALQNHVGLNFFCEDIASPKIFSMFDEQYFDCTIASGIFNEKLKEGSNKEHITKALQHMYALSSKTVCSDFMSSYVDYQQVESFHTDPAWIFNLAKFMSRWVLLRHDYMPYEFAVVIYRNRPET